MSLQYRATLLLRNHQNTLQDIKQKLLFAFENRLDTTIENHLSKFRNQSAQLTMGEARPSFKISRFEQLQNEAGAFQRLLTSHFMISDLDQSKIDELSKKVVKTKKPRKVNVAAQNVGVACPKCQKRFRNIVGLSSHMSLSHKDKMIRSFMCKPCTKWFKTSKQLAYHLLHTHGKLNKENGTRAYYDKESKQTFSEVLDVREFVRTNHKFLGYDSDEQDPEDNQENHENDENESQKQQQQQQQPQKPEDVLVVDLSESVIAID